MPFTSIPSGSVQVTGVSRRHMHARRRYARDPADRARAHAAPSRRPRAPSSSGERIARARRRGVNHRAVRVGGAAASIACTSSPSAGRRAARGRVRPPRRHHAPIQGALGRHGNLFIEQPGLHCHCIHRPADILAAGRSSGRSCGPFGRGLHRRDGLEPPAIAASRPSRHFRIREGRRRRRSQARLS